MAGQKGQPKNKGVRQKVKSGCRTCKRRKVKCDEGWPVCSRCQASGRKCDGYGIFGGGSDCTAQSEMGEVQKSLQLIALQSSEKDCYEWYVRRSATKLSGVFASDFWTSILLQASTSEPAVRHALVTLGSAHKEEVAGSHSIGKDVRDSQSIITMTQYSKAMKLVRVHNDDGKVARRAPLLACALFVSTEFLRGHYASGLLHLQYGLVLLQKQLEQVEKLDPALTCIDGWIITAFTRYMVQAKLLGQLASFPVLKIHVVDHSPTYGVFNSIHHARRCLDHIILNIINLHNTHRASVPDANAAPQQGQLRDALRKWLTIHQNTILQLPSSDSFFTQLAYRLLLPFCYVGFVLADTSLEPLNELAYDRCRPMFEKIVSHCLQTAQFICQHNRSNKRGHQDPESTSPNSITDMAWTAPLFFTTMKCRSHHLRCQALRIMQTTSHKEGIWNTPLMVRVAEFIIEKEEGSSYELAKLKQAEHGALPGDDDILYPTLPLGRRLSNIEISLPEDRVGKLKLTYLQYRDEGKLSTEDRTFDLSTQKWSASKSI